jgi:feruloyl esterase
MSLALALPATVAADSGKWHRERQTAPLSCGALADWLLEDDEKVLAASAQIVPASGSAPSYCQVNLTRYHAVNIRVGLPLNELDGGSGGVHGAWNGKIQNLGGGGFAGTVGSVVAPVTAGYVGSSTDTGHSRDWCNAINPETGQPNSQPNCGAGGAGFVLDPNNNLYEWQVRDFIRDSLRQQVLKAIDLAKAYYGRRHERNYWNGCSTGGRQGMEMAQSFGRLFDGILAGAPAMNWNRFQTGELWHPIVIRELLGSGGLSIAKYNAANAAAVAACDGEDGVVDGLIGEPRRCTYNAEARLCSAIPGDPNCLTPAEAQAINMIWDGPHDSKGRRLWGGLPIGTSVNIVASGSLMLTYQQNWVHQDPTWDLATVGIADFEHEFTLSNDKFQGWASTDDPDLDDFREGGGKLIHYHGLTDPLILPVGSWEYSSRVIERYGAKRSQKFMRSFYYPGNGHCGGGVAGAPLINGGALFQALVDWVENGVAPDHIVASSTSGSRTGKICMYPNEAVYVGTGDTNDAANYVCVVHRKEPADLKEWANFAPRKGDRGRRDRDDDRHDRDDD